MCVWGGDSSVVEAWGGGTTSNMTVERGGGRGRGRGRRGAGGVVVVWGVVEWLSLGGGFASNDQSCAAHMRSTQHDQAALLLTARRRCCWQCLRLQHQQHPAAHHPVACCSCLPPYRPAAALFPSPPQRPGTAAYSIEAALLALFLGDMVSSFFVARYDKGVLIGDRRTLIKIYLRFR